MKTDVLLSSREAATSQPAGSVVDAAVTAWPTVGVVVLTRGRPELLRRTLTAIWDQDYPGGVEVVVVFDGEKPDESLCREAAGGRIRMTTNTRTRGSAGARNSGIETLSTELVTFCDDDDLWSVGRLSTQVRRLRAEPDTEMLTCGIVVSVDGRQSPRLAGRDLIEYHQLLPSGLAMLHSSTFLLRRPALLDGIGLLDESIPGSQNKDWDLLLRAARRQPIRHVGEPLVRVLWESNSYFSPAVGNQKSLAAVDAAPASRHRRRSDRCRARVRAARLRPCRRRPAVEVRVLGGAVSAPTVAGAARHARLAVALRLLRAGPVVATLHRRGHGVDAGL